MSPATCRQVKVTKRWHPALLQLQLRPAGAPGWLTEEEVGRPHGDYHPRSPIPQGKATPSRQGKLLTSKPQSVLLSAWTQNTNLFSFSTGDPSQGRRGPHCLRIPPARSRTPAGHAAPGSPRFKHPLMPELDTRHREPCTFLRPFIKPFIKTCASPFL